MVQTVRVDEISERELVMIQHMVGEQVLALGSVNL